jgi:NHLM bacteriocin system ABC transporter peptidase/ATP-binding protein
MSLTEAPPRSIPRRRTPPVLQLEATECGAACLAMILAFHGNWTPLAEIRAVAGVSRDGIKASNIVKAAVHFGLKARGLSCEPTDLAKLPMPAVVFWNFNHFVVLEGRRGDRVWINDPAVGPRTISAEEFDQAFTGVVLTFEPGPQFRQQGEPPALLTGLRHRLQSFRPAVGAVALIGFLLLVPGLVIPGLQRAFTDYYLVAGLHGWLWWLIAGMLGAAALRMGLTWAQQILLARLNLRLGLQTTGRFLWHLLHLPTGFFAQRSSAEIANRPSLGDRLTALLTGSLIAASVNLIAIVVYAGVMAGYDWPLTALAVTFAATNLWLLVVSTRALSNAHRHMLQEEGRLQGLLFQGFASLESYRASGTEDLFFRRWAGAHAKVLGAEQIMTQTRRRLSGLALLLSSLTGIAIVLLGGLRVMDGAITIGMLIAFQMLTANFNAPVTSFVGLSAQLQDARGYMERLDDVLDQAADPMLGAVSSDAPVSPARGAISVSAVTFSYSLVAPPFVKDLSFDLEPGQRVAIVGASGSGKSTLGRLLVGLALPRSGKIHIDGAELTSLPPHELRSRVAYVEQAVTLFPGTVRDNITMWDTTRPDGRVVAAAKDACIHDAITTRPNGYESPVDEEGRNFSGGECQRLAIARALAGDPSVVVLDEATSALDALVERDILDNLRRRGCSSIIISHRLSAIRDCDEILVIENGAIAERGRHDALLALGGRYTRLVRA